MEKKQVLRLKPEVKEFVIACKLMKYILVAFGATFFMAMMIVAFCAGGERFDAELWGATLQLAIVMDGFILIIGTLADMAISLIGWLIRHRIKFNKIVTVEERNIEIV